MSKELHHNDLFDLYPSHSNAIYPLNIAGSIVCLGTQRSSGGVAGSVPSQQRSVYQGGSAHRGLGLPGAQGVRRHNEGAAQSCPYLSSV